jgi:murein DD-endopeptidase MepM/ murein hydrolase activator NlpD
MTKRFAALLLIFACSVSLLAYEWGTVRPYVVSVADSLLLPYRIARLTAEPPDETLVMPLHTVRVRDVADTWGEARSEGRTHEGQDLFAARGTSVNPVTRGYVVRVGENRLGGLTVFVLGQGGRGYYYAHLERHGPDAVLGTLVDESSVIGYVGTSGNASGTPPHLHLGIYTREGPINPYPFLVDRP